MFNIKTWIDRVSEFPTRRLLTKVSDGTSEQVIVTRDEGTVTTAGDTFDANTMNNLEARIASAFTADDQKMGALADLQTTDKSSLVAAINEAAQGGGGGGSSTLAGLTDVDINLPTNGQVLKYDATNQEWVNANESGGGGGGGTASDVSYDNTDSGLQATNAQAAIDEVAGGYVKKDFAIIQGTASIMATSANDAAVNATGNDTHGANMGVYNSEVDGSMHMNMSTTGVKELVVYDGNARRSVIIAQDAAGNYSGDVIDMIDEKADSTDLANYAPIASPDLTGTPTAPTAAAGTNTTQIATTAFVQNELDDINSDFAYDNQESVSIPNRTSPWTDICSFTLTAGIWLVLATINYTANASGYRCGLISSTSSASGADYRGTVIVAASPADVTRIQVMAILTPSSTTTFYVEGKQNSGSSLTVSARVQRIKLK